jgi:hypothetical protein
LDTYTLSEPIVYLSVPTSPDEMFLTALTDTDYLYLLPISLVDSELDQTTRKKSSSESKPLKDIKFGTAAAEVEKRINLREAMAKKASSSDAASTSNLRFKQVQVQKHRGKMMIQVLDSENKIQ